MSERVDLDALEADMDSLDFSHSLGVPEVSRLIAELRQLRRVEDALKARIVELELRNHVLEALNLSQNSGISNAVDAYARAADERDTLKSRIVELEVRNEALRAGIEGLMEGLDANCEGECLGISAEAWEKHIERARAALADDSSPATEERP